MPNNKKESLTNHLILLNHWNISTVLFILLTGVILTIAELSGDIFFKIISITTIIINWFLYANSDFKTNKFVKNCIKITLVFFILLLMMYVFLHFLNIYNLYRFKEVEMFCTKHTDVCATVTSIFFKLKIYRFITLSISLLLSFILFIGGLYFLNTYNSLTKIYIKKYVKSPLLFLSLILIFILFLNNMLTISDKIFSLTIKAWNNKHLHFYDRFVPYESGIEHGGWIWEYAKFINKNTNEHETIFVPPQNDIWAQEGNIHYFRWFLYPRNLVQSIDVTADIPLTADYILISRGGWLGGKPGWPKKMPKVECVETIHIINRKTLVAETVSTVDIDKNLNQDIWGIIKLKRSGNNTCQ